MENTGKKAFLFKVIGFIVFVIAVVLLVFLIKNDWNVGFAINEFIEFIKKLKEQSSS